MTDQHGKAAGLLGMCRRAGRLSLGFDATVTLFKAHKAALVLRASDLSEKTQKEWRFASSDAPLLALPFTKEDVGHMLGTGKPVGILAVSDPGFAAALRQCLSSTPTDNHTEEETHL